MIYLLLLTGSPSILIIVRILESSKDAEWLQNNQWSTTEVFLGLTYFLVSGHIPICKWSYTNMFTNSYIQESNAFTKIGLYKLETDKWQQRKDLCEFDPWNESCYLIWSYF